VQKTWVILRMPMLRTGFSAMSAYAAGQDSLALLAQLVEAEIK
jgi:hypothetical protein